jgi:MYXO-CTERM domain-containing protein
MLVGLLASVASADRYAPKGRPSIDGVAEAPHASARADPVFFLYAGYIDSPVGAVSAGAGAMMKQGDPGLAAGDSHSLGELAVISSDGKQIVEIGWHVDPLVNEDLQPRLFIFHWVDGQPTCYNGCGFVSTSTVVTPGMRVDAGATEAYQIELRGADWWLSYKGQDLGYFPGSLWTTTPYSAAGYIQWFGEIAAATASSCSEMGNGLFGSDPGAASMTGLYKIMPGGQHVPADGRTGTVTNAANWKIGQTTSTSFSFGGPGQGGGACCTPQSCAEAAAQCGQVPDTCGAPLACGACDNGHACDNFSCGYTEPPEPDGAEPVGPDGGTQVGPDGGMGGGDGDDDPSMTSAGCCQTGQGAAPALLPALGVLLALRRRRR